MTIRNCETGEKITMDCDVRAAIDIFTACTKVDPEGRQYVIYADGREIFVRYGKTSTSPIARR